MGGVHAPSDTAEAPPASVAACAMVSPQGWPLAAPPCSDQDDEWVELKVGKKIFVCLARIHSI